MAPVVLLMAVLAQGPPSWAHHVKTTVTKTADSEEVIVDVDGVQAGRRQDNDGVYDLVWERDPRALGLRHRLHPHKITTPFPAELDPIAPAEPAVSGDVPLVALDPAPVVIDVNYFYSAAAAAAAGGEDKMPAFMALSCALANQTYLNSGLGYITWRCFGPFKTAYTESLAPQTAIEWAVNNATGRAEVAQGYALTGADLTHYVVTINGCGIGYMFAASGSYAISQSERSCTNTNLTFPHETGHNLNYNHDPHNSGCTAISPVSGLEYCAGSDNYGHAFPTGAIKWRTIMSYPQAGGTRITQISNPAILYQGVPTGIVNERNNVRIGAVNAPTASKWRTAVNLPQMPAAPGKPTIH